VISIEHDDSALEEAVLLELAQDEPDLVVHLGDVRVHAPHVLPDELSIGQVRWDLWIQILIDPERVGCLGPYARLVRYAEVVAQGERSGGVPAGVGGGLDHRQNHWVGSAVP
jgi:hypothetical protein